MKPIEVIVPWLFGQYAMTIWPFVIYKRPIPMGAPIHWTGAIKAHERYHWRRQMAWLVVPWFVAYLLLLPFYMRRIKQHPLEREGYRIQAAVLRADD